MENTGLEKSVKQVKNAELESPVKQVENTELEKEVKPVGKTELEKLVGKTELEKSVGKTELEKLVKQVEIKSDGDVFHEIFRERPHHISTMSPGAIQNVDIHDGDWGKVGSVIFWNYTHDGKEKVAKEIMTALDEEKKSVTYQVIDGDILEHFKTFFITIHVDTAGENNLVTWTFEYEKLNEDVEDPNSLMDFCIGVSKDIETHHLTN